MKLFQYAVVLHPTTEESKKGQSSKVIVDVKTVVAKDDQGALLQAAREIPEDQMAHSERLEVFVRPF